MKGFIKKNAIKNVFRQQVIDITPLLTIIDLRLGEQILMNGILANVDMQINFDILKKINGKSDLGSFYYFPVRFSRKERISKIDKLLLCFNTFVASEIQGRIPDYGEIIYGNSFKVSKISTSDYLPQVKNILSELRNFMETNEEPVLTITDRCRNCNFCQNLALEKDDLSLIRGMSSKEIVKQNNKGIFTVTQLSYTFRPRKIRKRAKAYTRTHFFELKALAVREKKIYVYREFELPSSSVQMYFDIEGNEYNTFRYLIGLVVVKGNSVKRYSFWADNENQEKQILEKFITICQQYQDYKLYHYGTYETKFLRDQKKKLPKKYGLSIDKILKNTVNVLTIVYEHIYFPTYSNELKDIANYLEFHWSDENASGVQSIVWRLKWEQNQDENLKQKLIQYNLEDCIALKKITEYAYKIEKYGHKQDGRSKIDINWAEELKDNKNNYKWGTINFLLPDFELINKAAYFDYQRDKIFIRTNNNLNKHKKKTLRRNSYVRINKFITIKAYSRCPYCKSNKLTGGSRYKRIVTDLKFLNFGLKKWVVQYTTKIRQCISCKKMLMSPKFRETRGKYGYNVKCWVIYQNIVNGESFVSIGRNLQELFHITIDRRTLLRFKAELAEDYIFTFRKIMKNVIQGKIIHADETGVNLKDKTGYVWIFTNMEEVIFLIKPSREGLFLKKFLKGFTGVLISDFYAAYDSLDCPQQKCLIHLIRDLNEDLLKSPFDKEYKDFVQQFAKLLKKIIKTIDKYGLRKRNLNKHKKDVKKFYKNMSKQKYISELVEKYKKRFEKNEDKLFTFLNYTGVPWNNNNAEHAIKHFAMYRRNVDGLLTEEGAKQYLILLSIFQTCQYKNINFLQFLLSRKKDIGSYKH